MAPPRRILVFAVAALLPLTVKCQGTRVFPCLHVEKFTAAGNIGAANGSDQSAHRIFGEQAEASFFFFKPRAWEGYRRYMILVGAALLLAQTVIIVLQISKRKRSDQTVRRLTRRLILAGEDERRHLARELHDDIGQRLSLVSVELGSLSWNRAGRRQSGDQMLEQALEELRTLISDVHSLSHSLHSSKLEHLGLHDALKELCQQIAQRQEIEIDLQMDEVRSNLDRDIALCFYRVAQEALSNVVKHSSSSRVAVRLAASRETLKLQVKDDGTGFDPPNTPVGLGLVTMEERLRIVGGKLSVASKPGEGTIVTAEVSLAHLNIQKGNESRKRAKVPTC